MGSNFRFCYWSLQQCIAKAALTLRAGSHHQSLAQAHLPECITRCLAVTGRDSVYECGRLKQPNWHLGALNILNYLVLSSGKANQSSVFHWRSVASRSAPHLSKSASFCLFIAGLINLKVVHYFFVKCLFTTSLWSRNKLFDYILEAMWFRIQ